MDENKKQLLPMNLQFFGEGDDQAKDDHADGANDKADDGKDKGEEIQAKIDAAVKAAMNAKSAKERIDRKAQDNKAGDEKPDMPDFSSEIEELRGQLMQRDVELEVSKYGILPNMSEIATKLIEMDAVIVDGKVDKAALKKELDRVTKLIPSLKQTAENDSKNGFKIGADGGQEKTTEAELKNIFGLKK